MSKSAELVLAAAVSAALALPAAAQVYGLGRLAHPEEIAAWDVAVLPDGTGLRPGRGTVLDGEELFVDYCAACHGDFGEGAGAWPPLAGGEGTLTRERPLKTIGSYWPYLSTAWDYIHRSMPFGAAQSLTVDEVYAITAYLLYLNGLVDEDFELSHENFLEIRLPNEDGFYEDDRDTTEVPLFSQEPCMRDCREPPRVTFRATRLNVTPIELPPANIPGWDAASAPRSVAGMEGSVLPTAAPTAQATPADAAPAPAPESEVAATGPDPALIAQGEAVFRQCRSCHMVGEGARHGTGPLLNGILGRKAGTLSGFRYSPQLVAAGEGGLIWTEETLDAFLENPSAYIPRNRMAFRGLRSAEDRAAVIAYLATFAE